MVRQIVWGNACPGLPVLLEQTVADLKLTNVLNVTVNTVLVFVLVKTADGANLSRLHLLVLFRVSMGIVRISSMLVLASRVTFSIPVSRETRWHFRKVMTVTVTSVNRTYGTLTLKACTKKLCEKVLTVLNRLTMTIVHVARVKKVVFLLVGPFKFPLTHVQKVLEPATCRVTWARFMVKRTSIRFVTIRVLIVFGLLTRKVIGRNLVIMSRGLVVVMAKNVTLSGFTPL